MGSGWDQRNDNDREPDTELRWITAFTVLAICGIIIWFMWPLTK